MHRLSRRMALGMHRSWEGEGGTGRVGTWGHRAVGGRAAVGLFLPNHLPPLNIHLDTLQWRWARTLAVFHSAAHPYRFGCLLSLLTRAGVFPVVRAAQRPLATSPGELPAARPRGRQHPHVRVWGEPRCPCHEV